MYRQPSAVVVVVCGRAHVASATVPPEGVTFLEVVDRQWPAMPMIGDLSAVAAPEAGLEPEVSSQSLEEPAIRVILY